VLEAEALREKSFMSWLILLVISLVTIIRSSCDKSNVNINDHDKQGFCPRIVDDDSLCKDQVCKRIIDIYCQHNLMEENGKFV